MARDTTYFHLIVLLQFVIIANGQQNSELEEKWFEQYVTHYNVVDNRTFIQRYFEEDKHFKPGGPIIIQIGGQGGISSEDLTRGQGIQIASRLNGHVFLLEHRFYGESAPFNNPLSLKKWRYLHIDQILRDLAYFINSIKNSTPQLKKSKVVLIGCAYAGSLAIWARYKFPHLVDAVWASSAPLRAVIDFREYFKVSKDLGLSKRARCIGIIQQGNRELRQMLLTSHGKIRVRTMLEGWKACGNVKNMNKEELLAFTCLVLLYQYTVNNAYTCASLERIKANADTFVAIEGFVTEISGEVCSEINSNDVSAWLYQWCTQFSFLVTNSTKQPYNKNSYRYTYINEEVDYCVQLFGEGYTIKTLTRQLNSINRIYGFSHPQVTQVVSVFGSDDPWHKVGLYAQPNDKSKKLIIQGTSYCADLSNSKEATVVETRKEVYETFENWLKNS